MCLLLRTIPEHPGQSHEPVCQQEFGWTWRTSSVVPLGQILNHRHCDAVCEDVNDAQGTSNMTSAQACAQTQGAPHHHPWLVSLSQNTTAGICFASLCCCAWILPDLLSNVESRRAKLSSLGQSCLLQQHYISLELRHQPKPI